MPGKLEQRRIFWISGVLLALLAQMIFTRHLLGGFVRVDFLLIFVAYHAITKFENGGLIAGAVAGLLQDCFSGGPLGVFAFSLTLVGFSLGSMSRRFLLNRPLLYPLALGAATLVNDLIVFFLLSVPLEIGVGLQFFHIVYRILWNTFCGVLMMIFAQRVFRTGHQVVW